MAVLQYPIAIPATVGTLPSLKFMATTDDLTTVVTPGYLNSSNIDAGNPIAKTDVIMALVSFDTRFQTGIFDIFVVDITVTGVITLSLWKNPGVILPVIPGHIAQFFDTSGTIYDGTDPAIHFGQIQAGSSGIAGSYITYPGSPLSGYLSFAASNNSGNFIGVITNAALGQTTTFIIPNPAASSANFCLSPAPMVNGNLVKASGTNGLLVDAGVAANQLMALNLVNTLSPTGSIVANKVSGTEAANAVTANGMAGVITTSSLSTAGGASYAINWTNSFISATSVVMMTISGGTNTVQNTTLHCVPGAGTATLTIYNNTAATPLNGTILISYLVM